MIVYNSTSSVNVQNHLNANVLESLCFLFCFVFSLFFSIFYFYFLTFKSAYIAQLKNFWAQTQQVLVSPFRDSSFSINWKARWITWHILYSQWLVNISSEFFMTALVTCSLEPGSGGFHHKVVDQLSFHFPYGTGWQGQSGGLQET